MKGRKAAGQKKDCTGAATGEREIHTSVPAQPGLRQAAQLPPFIYTPASS